MNRGRLPEMMLRSAVNMDAGNAAEMTVLERQRSRQKWPQQEPVAEYFNESHGVFPAGLGRDQGIGEMLVAAAAMKPDPEVGNGWNNDYRGVLSFGNGSGFEMGYGIARSFSSPPNAVAAVNKGKEVAHGSGGAAPVAGKESSKKRKAEKTQTLKPIPEEKSEEKKKKKASVEEDSKMTEQNSNSKSSTTTASTNTNNNKKPAANNKKPAEIPKPDYIHVRARRGQATDSHSLAERVRREKISERMKYLQDLVPGCNKITGKAGMLDEIINYVQSLQRQVEFLSMKLATVNPRLDLDIHNYLLKEAMTANIPAIGTSSDMVNLQYTALGHGILGSNLELVGDNPIPMDATLRRTTSAPVHNFLESPNVNQIQQQLTWEDELQNLYSMEYQQGRSTPFISQPFTGFLESGNVKMEM